MTNTAILALDKGKCKSVACAYDGHPAAAHFRTLATCRAELARLIDRHRPAVVVIEACALAGWVHDLCAERGVACKVANIASEAWKFKHAKRKTEGRRPPPGATGGARTAADRHDPAQANPRVARPDRLP